MKNTLILTLILVVFAACQTDASTVSAGEEGNFEVAKEDSLTAKSDTQKNATSKSFVIDDKLVPPPPPAPVASERIEKSTMAATACCDQPTAVTVCCCDKLIETYRKLLLAEDIDAAGELETNDPFYTPCQVKFTDFEDRIIEVQDEVLGDSN